MKHLSIMALIISSACFTGQVLANSSNIALNKAVTLSGVFGTDQGPWTYQSSVPAQTLTDGVFLAEHSQWNIGSVWWNGYTNPGNYAQIDLGGLFAIDSFKIQADDNDTYRMEYKVGNGNWQTTWYFLAPGGWGLTTSSGAPASPILADALRFTAIGGDGYYSVSEIQAFGASAVPVPAAVWLLGSGLLGLVGVARRSKPA